MFGAFGLFYYTWVVQCALFEKNDLFFTNFTQWPSASWTFIISMLFWYKIHAKGLRWSGYPALLWCMTGLNLLLLILSKVTVYQWVEECTHFYAWGKLRLHFATTYLLNRLQLLRAVVSIKDSFTLQDRNQDFEVGTIQGLQGQFIVWWTQYCRP